jgi:hypothetical protein
MTKSMDVNLQTRWCWTDSCFTSKLHYIWGWGNTVPRIECSLDPHTQPESGNRDTNYCLCWDLNSGHSVHHQLLYWPNYPPSVLFVAEEYHLLGFVAVLSDRNIRSFSMRRRFSTIRRIEDSSVGIVAGSGLNNRLQFRRADWDFTNFLILRTIRLPIQLVTTSNQP